MLRTLIATAAVTVNDAAGLVKVPPTPKTTRHH